jgi:hypothetical protein
MALMLTLIWQGTTATYNAGYFRSAVGVQLDRLLDLVGIKRLGALASTVTLTVYGNNGVNVPLGTVATADDSESSWSTVASVATSDAIRVVRVLTFQSGTYTVDIDGTPYTTVAPAPSPSTTTADPPPRVSMASTTSGVTVFISRRAGPSSRIWVPKPVPPFFFAMGCLLITFSDQ